MTNSLRGQVAVVTGTDSGVGRSAAEMLLRAGAHVTMICLDGRRGQQALDELSSAVELDKSGPNLALEIANLSRQSDVRAAAHRIAARLPAINILVNNAGIYPPRRVLSADGFELTFATNYLGHFLLTRILLDRLEAGRGCIVNVSSRVHRGGSLQRASLEDIARGREWSGRLQAYMDSKLANVLFTLESARRWRDRGITANALHPGVLWTGIWKHSPLPVRLLVRPLTWAIKQPDVGGEAVMGIVGHDSPETLTGRYFHIQEEAEPSDQARDVALATNLWERSMEWTEC